MAKPPREYDDHSSEAPGGHWMWGSFWSWSSPRVLAAGLHPSDCCSSSCSKKWLAYNAKFNYWHIINLASKKEKTLNRVIKAQPQSQTRTETSLWIWGLGSWLWQSKKATRKTLPLNMSSPRNIQAFVQTQSPDSQNPGTEGHPPTDTVSKIALLYIPSCELPFAWSSLAWVDLWMYNIIYFQSDIGLLWRKNIIEMWQQIWDRIHDHHSSFAHHEKDTYGKTHKKGNWHLYKWNSLVLLNSKSQEAFVLYNIVIINTTGHNIK